MLGSIFSSARSALSPYEVLDLANDYLESARRHKNLKIALILCDDAEASLSQMKKALRKADAPETLADQTLRGKIAAVYFEHGKVLEKLDQRDKAQASFKKAEKYGYVQGQAASPATPRPDSTRNSIYSALIPSSTFVASPRHSSLLSQRSTGRDSAVLPPALFAQNVPPPLLQYDLPKADERLSSTPQLAYALSLSLAAALSDIPLSPEERTWSQATAENADETERLQTLATDVVRAFINDELKEGETVAEVTCLAPILERENGRKLLMKFIDGIEHTVLLDVHLLKGLAHLMQNSASDYLAEDDLVKLLDHLGTRLKETHGQSTQYMYQLTLAVSQVLDAMADSHVTNLARETLHAPLAAYLEGLQQSDDPYLVYQAAYAFQALLYVPDDETPWQAAFRRTSTVIEGVAKLVSAVKGVDLNGFIEGLGRIQEGVAGASGAIKALKEGYDTVISLTESGQSFLAGLKEGFSFTRKSAWYSALRGADTLLRNGQLAEFKQLVCEAPCRRDVAFQWGLCERLGQLAANAQWDATTRQSAITFLAELYKDDATWGQQASVKQWILKLLMRLADGSASAAAADTLLQALAKEGDAHKQAFYQTCLKEDQGVCLYPLDMTPPSTASTSLLDRVQNKPDVETDVRNSNTAVKSTGQRRIYCPPRQT